MKTLIQFLIFTILVACAFITMVTFEINPPSFVFMLIGSISYIISYVTIEMVLGYKYSNNVTTHVDYNVIDDNGFVIGSDSLRIQSRRVLTLQELEKRITEADNVKITNLIIIK